MSVERLVEGVLLPGFSGTTVPDWLARMAPCRWLVLEACEHAVIRRQPVGQPSVEEEPEAPRATTRRPD